MKQSELDSMSIDELWMLHERIAATLTAKINAEGVDSPEARASLYSTVHGAGRLFGRKEAKRRFTRAEMDAWLQERGVTLVGADLDESPMAYRRLPEVIAQHAGSVKVLHTLRPFAVAMAGEGEFDPFKD